LLLIITSTADELSACTAIGEGCLLLREREGKGMRKGKEGEGRRQGEEREGRGRTTCISNYFRPCLSRGVDLSTVGGRTHSGQSTPH